MHATTCGRDPISYSAGYWSNSRLYLDDLIKAQGQKIEALYTYIYRQAWERLDELTRQVFLAMPLVTEAGGRLEDLVALSGVSVADSRHALEQLIDLNLADTQDVTQDTRYEKRYLIHPLTRSFLQEQVIKW